MDQFIQEFNQLSVSKKRKSKRQVAKAPSKDAIFTPLKIIVDPCVLKVNEAIISNSEHNCNKINKVLTYIDLDKNGKEFMDLKVLFEKSNLRIKSVKKIDNPYLKKAFELKRNLHYKGKHPLRLFHGTKKKYVDSISTYNFNWRFGGYETGHKYGKGVNFTSSPYFATFFCDRKWNRVMILAEVLVDVTQPGNENMVVPPRGSDTTSGKNGIVFVKFYDNEFYPKYVINFGMMYRK